MIRWVCIACLLIHAVAASAEVYEAEELANAAAGEIHDNLTLARNRVAYVGMEGRRAYLSGDMAGIRTGSAVAFYRESDKRPVEIGRGEIAAIHDRTAWIKIDSESVGRIKQDDLALVRLPAPYVRVAPFFIDEGKGGKAKLDGRSRVLRSLLMYNLKRAGLAVADAPITEFDVDASGLPTPEALKLFDTDGVLVIGRVLPDEGTGGREQTVGVVVFDLGVRDVRYARSWQVRALSAFVPTGRSPDPVRATGPRLDQPTAPTPKPPPPPKPIPPPIAPGTVRLYLPAAPRFFWPPQTPADHLLLQLTAPTLPDLALEWIADTHGWVTVRMVRTEEAGEGAPATPTAEAVARLLSGRVREPKGRALAGSVGFSAASDRDILIQSEQPVPDLRARLADPYFSLVDTFLSPLAPHLGPYDLSEKAARKIILTKSAWGKTNAAWKHAPETIEFTVEPDARRRSRGFFSEEADLHEILDEEFMKFSEGSGRRTAKSPSEELVVLGFNMGRPALSSPHTRRMVAMAIDRRGAVEMFLNRRGTPAEGLFPPSAEASPIILTQIPDRSVLAAQLLAQDRAETLPLLLVYPAEDPQYGLIAESVRSDLAALNVHLTLRALPWRNFSEALESGDFDLAISALTPRAPWRLWLEQAFSSGGKDNVWRYKSPVVDAMVSEDGDLGAAQDVILSELPVIPLFWLSHHIALGPRVESAWPSRSALKFFSSIRLK